MIITDNRCVCCGETIPEGRMVCPTCESKSHDAPTMTMKNFFTEEVIKKTYVMIDKMEKYLGLKLPSRKKETFNK